MIADCLKKLLVLEVVGILGDSELIGPENL